MNKQELSELFLLRPDITYLNFGSFGACPQPIFDEYQKWQRLLEAEPVQFIAVNAAENLKAARQALGSYLSCHEDDVVLVTNPTYAVNIIAKNLALQEGDEILTTDLEYGAMDRTWNYYCKQHKARYVRQTIPLPLNSKEAFLEAFWKGLSSKTRAIFISHITSSTALRLPVEELCAMAKAKGLVTIVDGAHAPAQIPLNLSTLQADIYTGACHKWMMGPKGSSFLYVRREMQHLFDPLVISWGYESASPSHSQFLDYHQMQGTRDFSAFLTMPKVVSFLREQHWETIAYDCRMMARENYTRFCDLMGSAPLCALTDDFNVQICSIPIRTTAPEKLQKHLFDHYKIEVPVMRHDDKVYLRYSVQVFNTQQQYDKLYAALKELF
jgi:isopenicillin-N epimerase